MPRNITLTTEDRQYLRSHLASGYITQDDFPAIIRRMQLDPDLDGALKRAIVDTTQGMRMRREVEGVRQVIEDPSLITENIKDYYGREGAVKGTAKIAVEAVTSPFQIIAQGLSGDYIETPLQSTFEVASLGLMGARGVAALGSGLARTPRTAARLAGVADSPALKWGGRITEAGEVVTAGEESWKELAGEALVSGPIEVASRRSRRNAEVRLREERELAEIMEINPETGVEVQGKRDRQPGRKRRAYVLPDGGVVTVERTASGNRGWQAVMPDGSTVDLSNQNDVFGFESAFNKAVNQQGGEVSAEQAGVTEERQAEAAPAVDGSGTPAQAEQPSGEVDSGVDTTPAETETVEETREQRQARQNTERARQATEDPERYGKDIWNLILTTMQDDGTLPDPDFATPEDVARFEQMRNTRLNSIRPYVTPEVLNSIREEITNQWNYHIGEVRTDAETDTEAEETKETDQTEELQDTAADTGADAESATDAEGEQTEQAADARDTETEAAAQRVISSVRGVDKPFIDALYEQIQGGTPVYFHGKEIRSGAEAAMLSYLVRNPNIEKTTVFYMKGDEIVGYSLQSSNSRLTTETAPEITENLRMLGADGFYRVHNHPGGDVTQSEGDQRSADETQAEYGELFRGDIVIDTDHYSEVTYDADGTKHYRDDISIDYPSETQVAQVASEAKASTQWLSLVMTNSNNEVVWFQEMERGVEMLNNAAVRESLTEVMEHHGAVQIDLVMSEVPIRDAVENLSDSYIEQATRSVWVDGRELQITDRDMRSVVGPEATDAEVEEAFAAVSTPPEGEQQGEEAAADAEAQQTTETGEETQTPPEVSGSEELPAPTSPGTTPPEQSETIPPKTPPEVTDESDVDEGTGEETVDTEGDGEGEVTGTAADRSVSGGEAIAPNAPTPEGRFAFSLLDRLRQGENTTDYREFYQLADEAWGGTREDGVYTEQDAYDVAELAGNLYIRETMTTMDQELNEAQESIGLIRENMEERLPTQSVRTQERQDRQQYSTPFSYGYAVNWIANIDQSDTILEPSAGTGNLAVYGEAIDADMVVNEIDPHRQAMLSLLGFENVTAHDAERIDNLLDTSIEPTVVVMNPPFSMTATGIADKRAGGNHVIHALRRLRPGGRLVTIVGGGINKKGDTELKGMATDSKSYREFWESAHALATLKANVHVNGKVYQRFGAPYDTRVLVFDKPIEGNPVRGAQIEGSVQTIEELVSTLEEVRNARQPIPPTETGGTVKRGESAEPGSPGASEGSGDTGGTGGGQLRPAPRTPAAGVGAGSDTGSDTGSVAGADDGAARQPSVDDTETGNQLPPSDPGGAKDTVTGTVTGERQSDDGGESGDGSDASEVGGGQRDTGSAVTDAEQLASEGRANIPAERVQQESDTGSGEVAEADEQAAVWRGYAPTAATIPANAQPHAGALDESAAMADIDLPQATYTPNLPQELIDTGALSAAQLEFITYAGQAHAQMVQQPEGRRGRAGIFLGDGTGVGKGRQVAGVVLDNLRQGRNKAVWISANQGLFNDAKRDLEDLNMDAGRAFNLSDTATGANVKQSQGIMYVTFDTMKEVNQTGTVSRVDQIVNWFGENYDGVLIFDEAHKMGAALEIKEGRYRKEMSQTAAAGMELQARMPNARVIYASATGATELVNLTYLDRIGLWGPGTSFPDKANFVTEMSKGGIAAMEVVARDMKAMGRYLRRSLSYRGIEYSQLQHDLTPDQTRIYNAMGSMWQEVYRRMQNIRDDKGIKKDNRLSAFWGANQRFFNLVLTAMQMPSLIDDISAKVEGGDAVVVQLTSTNEAMTNRELLNAEQQGIDLEDVSVTPKDILREFLMNVFPVQDYERVMEDGRMVSRIVTDANGDPVIDRAAEAERDALVQQLDALPVPDGALDQLIDQFGTDMVAEYTGRTRRLVTKPNGERTIERVGGKRRTADANAFMDDKKRILVFSKAGNTGLSYHADLRRKNQRKRWHYLIEPGWIAADAMQGLGRTHRTNQAQPPHYVLVKTNVAGQKRFMASIVRRLDQLGALTTGERRSTGGGLMNPEDNLDTEYGRDALRNLMLGINLGTIEVRYPLADGRELTLDLNSIEAALGVTMRDPDTGTFSVGKVPTITQFLNRVLALHIDQQNALFEAFVEQVNGVLEYHRQSGTLDVGTETIPALEAAEIASQTVFTHEASGAETRLETIELTTPALKYTLQEAMQRMNFRRFVSSATGKIYAEFQAPFRTRRATGQTVQMVRWIGPNSARSIELDSISQDTEDLGGGVTPAIERQWESEYNSTPDTETSHLYLLTGTILPIWDRLPEDSSPSIRRVFLNDGTTRLGRVIEESELPEFNQRLGVAINAAGGIVQQESMESPQVLEEIVENNKRLELANGWELKRSTIMDAEWIEVIGPDDQDLGYLREIGVEIRRAGAIRYLIPSREFNGLPILERLIGRHRVIGESQGRQRRQLDVPETTPTATTTPEQTITEETSPTPITVTRQQVENAAAGLNVGTASTAEVLEQIYGRLNVEQLRAGGRSAVLWTTEDKPGIVAQIRDIQLARTGEAVAQQEQQRQQEQEAEAPAETSSPTGAESVDPDSITHAERSWARYEVNALFNEQRTIGARGEVTQEEYDRRQSVEIGKRRTAQELPDETRGRLADDALWKRIGRSGEFVHEDGGRITVDKSFAIFTIPDVGRFERISSGKNHGERFDNALFKLVEMMTDQARVEAERQAEFAAIEEEESGTPTEIEARKSGGVPNPTFDEELSEDADGSILYHEDIDMGYEDLERAVAEKPEYDIRDDIADASYIRRRAAGWELIEETEASEMIVEVMDRSLEAFAEFIKHYTRGVEGLGAPEQGRFVEDASKEEMLLNALRATSGVARINPAGGTLFDVQVETMRDVIAEVQKVVPEATLVLPKKSINYAGKGKRGSGTGFDQVIRTLETHAPVIMKKLQAWTPRLRQRFLEAKAELFSGIAALDDMGEPGQELRDVLSRMVRLQKHMENRSRLAFYGTKEEPGPAPKFDKFSRDRYKQSGLVGEFVDFQSEMEESIWDYIQDNKQIDDPELMEIAQEWKEMWREEYRRNVHFMIELQKMFEAAGYSLHIVNRKGKRKNWRPLSAEFGWSHKQKMFTKGRGKNIQHVSIDDAIDQMERIWTPHFYPPSHFEDKIARMERRRAILDDLDPNTNEIPGFRYMENDSRGTGWWWTEGAEGESRPFFKDRMEALRYARDEAAISISTAREQLAALQQGAPREGHLERERETNDQLYTKKLSLLYDMQMRFAQRAGEIRFFGQFDPRQGRFGGSPIFRNYLANIRQYVADDQELAVREFVKPLLEYDKFAQLKGFSPDEPRTAFTAIRRWAEGKDSPIDPNRVFEDNPDITQEMKDTLVRVGLLSENNGTMEDRGQPRSSIVQYTVQNNTAVQRVLGDYFATVALRENTAYTIFNGLNSKDSVDPVEVQGQNFWKALNDVTTIGTLGVTASVQNLAEMPIMVAMAGNKSAMKGLMQFMQDKDMRDAGLWLGSAMGQTKEYLSEGGEFTSRWLDFIRFNWSDQLGRGIGTLAGVDRVKDDMLAYLNDNSRENAERLSDYGVSSKVLDEFMADGGTADRLSRVFNEFDERFKSGLLPVEGVRFEGGAAAQDAWTDIIGDEIGRGASFISDASFKQYNRLSLNSLLAQRDPRIRIFLKYQAWAFQQSALILRLTKRAFARAAKGDMRSLFWLISTAGALTTAYVGMRWVYDILQQRDDDKELGDRMIQAFSEAQAAGYLSMVLEIIRRADGSSYEAMHSIMFQLSPPIGTFALRPFAEAVTQDSIIGGIGAGAQETLKQSPGVREARRFFGFVLPEGWR